MIKNTTLFLIFIGIILFSIVFVFIKTEQKINRNIINEQQNFNGEAQKIILSMKDFNYYPNKIEVKSGQPVEITLDESVKGCLRAFTIRDLGITQYVRTPEEVIRFIPNKKGTFTFSCTMGMAWGEIVIK